MSSRFQVFIQFGHRATRPISFHFTPERGASKHMLGQRFNWTPWRNGPTRIPPQTNDPIIHRDGARDSYIHTKLCWDLNRVGAERLQLER